MACSPASRSSTSRSTLIDGSYHDVDSNEMAFKIAGSMAFKEGFKKASPVLLEPIMKVEVVTPEDYMGDVMGDVSRRRGILQGSGRHPVGQGDQRHAAAGRDVRLRHQRCARCRRVARPSRWNSTITRKRRPTSPKRSSRRTDERAGTRPAFAIPSAFSRIQR